MIKRWCKKVEFPIIVSDLGTESVISAENPKDIEYEIPVKTKNGVFFRLKSYPINSHGIEGEVYVFSMKDENGEERLDKYRWAEYDYPKLHVAATEPTLPDNLVCFNGITISMPYSSEPFRYRVDIRKKTELPMSRRAFFEENGIPEIKTRMEEILRTHLNESNLAKSQDGWVYKNRLVSSFPFRPFWNSNPQMIKAFKEDKIFMTTFDDVYSSETFSIRIDSKYVSDINFIHSHECKTLDSDRCNCSMEIRLEDFTYLSKDFRTDLLRGRIISFFKKSTEETLAVELTRSSERSGQENASKFRSEFLFGIMNPLVVAVHADYIGIIFNITNSFVKWLLLVDDAGERKKANISEAFEKIVKNLENTAIYIWVMKK